MGLGSRRAYLLSGRPLGFFSLSVGYNGGFPSFCESSHIRDRVRLVLVLTEVGTHVIEPLPHLLTIFIEGLDLILSLFVESLLLCIISTSD